LDNAEQTMNLGLMLHILNQDYKLGACFLSLSAQAHVCLTHQAEAGVTLFIQQSDDFIAYISQCDNPTSWIITKFNNGDCDHIFKTKVNFS
jgi:hypothetical protein